MLSKLVLILILFSNLCTPTCYSGDTGFRVAVIDTGIDLNDSRFRDVLCYSGHIDLTGEGIQDYNGHGTHVVGILAKAAPDHYKYCIVIIKAYKRGKTSMEVYLEALRYVRSQGITLVNISMSGEVLDYKERALLATTKATFVVSAGNQGVNYHQAYPAGYDLPNVKVVGNFDCQKNIPGLASNYGPGVIWRCGTNILSAVPGGTAVMTGTSMATPLVTAEIINRLTK